MGGTGRRIVVAGSILLLVVATTAQAASPSPAAVELCGDDGLPCWVAGTLAASALLVFVAVARTVVLARRIRRRPRTPQEDLPPELRDEPEPEHVAPSAYPDLHAAWPDPDARPRRPRTPPKQQIHWGDHRLWFHDGRYFFSADAEDDEWLPCLVVPKGHRIVVGQDGVPRLERVDPRHRRD